MILDTAGYDDFYTWAKDATPLLLKYDKNKNFDKRLNDILNSGRPWHVWARNVCSMSDIVSQNPPDPMTYVSGSWVDWANQFNAAVS